MSKQIILDTIEKIKTNSYSWNMYFFKIDKRNTNPYAVYKVRFQNRDYLPTYVEKLTQMMEMYQLSEIDKVEDYTGENSKVSCDKIAVDNDLIKANWDYLVQDVVDASDRKVKEKYNGYIVEGQPINEESGGKNIIMVKIANPVINLQNKRSVVFRFDESQALASITDDVCKLYMDVDYIVIDKNLYTFNYRFENMFNIEKTMQKVKNNAIEKIVEIGALDDVGVFREYIKSYKSPRTFITISEERIERIKDKRKRKNVAKMLELDLSPDGKFVFKNEEEAYKLVKYLCFKLFKDGETEELLEANNVTKYAG